MVGCAVTFPSKSPVVGTPISMTSYDEVIELLQERPTDRATVIAVCNVHSVMSARRDPVLARALREAQVATSDGMPLVWALRWTARPEQQRVYGPILMRKALQATAGTGLRHFFYGSAPETLQALERGVERLAPGSAVAGSFSPPFRPQTSEERAEILATIRDAGTDVLWVGLGMPKQELWMHQVQAELPGIALVGVGAAFDFIAGTKREAPPVLQAVGLEWAFRLSEEPRRLWRRYAWNNPAFIALLARQVVRERYGRGRVAPGS